MPLSTARAEQPAIPLQFLARASQKNPGITWKSMGKSVGGFASITRPLMSDNTKKKRIGK